MVQVGPCHSVYVVEFAVVSSYGQPAHFARDYITENRQLYTPSGKHGVILAIQDMGIPEPCTDILYLLIEQVLYLLMLYPFE